MVIASSYPFPGTLWSMLMFFAFVIWIWIAITVLVDLFRRHDVGWWAKALWLTFIIIAPRTPQTRRSLCPNGGPNVRARASRASTDAHARPPKSPASHADPSGTPGSVASARAAWEADALPTELRPRTRVNPTGLRRILPASQRPALLPSPHA